MGREQRRGEGQHQGKRREDKGIAGKRGKEREGIGPR